MTIETTLPLRLGKEFYTLNVKMIRIEQASYFFIRNEELLAGRTLEITYSESFSLTEFGGIVKSPEIPEKIVSAIQQELLQNKQRWLL